MSILANGAQIQNKNAGAVKDLMTSEPPPVEKLNWLIHLFHVRGEAACCKDLIEDEIEKSRGTNDFAYYKKGVILREEGKVQESLETFQLCHKLNPENVDNFKEIGKCLYMLKRYRLSLEAYLEAENVSHKADWEIFHKIAECYLRLNDVAKAKDYCQKAVQLGKQEISYSLLIKILISEGDLRSAVSVCNAATEYCQDSVAMLTSSGILHLKTGDTQQAFEKLSSALALDPSNSKALLGVGSITQNHEEFDVALSKYKIAVQTDNDSVALWNNIGMCFYSKQKYIAAVTCLKRALWLSPLNWRVLLNLGLVNLSTNQPASAFNFLCAAVNIRSDIGLPFMVLGCALLELQDKNNALRAVSQALTLNPEDVFILANTCLCFLLTGHEEAARQVMEKLRNITQTFKNKEVSSLVDKIENILQSGQVVEPGTDVDRAGDEVPEYVEPQEDEV